MPISCSIYLIFKHLENACYKLLCRVHVKIAKCPKNKELTFSVKMLVLTFFGQNA